MGNISTYARFCRDDNDVPDKDEAPVNKEDDLVQGTLVIKPNNLAVGKVTLTAPSDKIQAWTKKDKSGDDGNLLATGSKEWDLATEKISSPVFFEGIKMSESAQDIDIELKFKNGDCEIKDVVKATVAVIDLDVDSDNDGEIEVADDEEDALEDAEKEPGLMICVNDDDDNEDDAADCLNNVVDGEDDKADMAEMKVTAPELTVDANDVTLTLKRKKIDNYEGQIRVFDKDYNEVLAPDARKVELPEAVKADLLANGSYSFYLEGVENGARQLELTMEVDLNGKTSKFSDVVTVSVFGFSPQGSHTYDVAEAAGSSSSSYAGFAARGLIGMLAAANPVSAEVSHSEAFDMGNKTFFVTGDFDYQNPLFAIINAGPMDGKPSFSLEDYNNKFYIQDAGLKRKYSRVIDAQSYDGLINVINFFRSGIYGFPPIDSSFNDLCSSYGLSPLHFLNGLYYISVDPKVPLSVGYLYPGVYSLEVRAKDSEQAVPSGEYKLFCTKMDIDANPNDEQFPNTGEEEDIEEDPGVPLLAIPELKPDAENEFDVIYNDEVYVKIYSLGCDHKDFRRTIFIPGISHKGTSHPAFLVFDGNTDITSSLKPDVGDFYLTIGNDNDMVYRFFLNPALTDKEGFEDYYKGNSFDIGLGTIKKGIGQSSKITIYDYVRIFVVHGEFTNPVSSYGVDDFSFPGPAGNLFCSVRLNDQFKVTAEVVPEEILSSVSFESDSAATVSPTETSSTIEELTVIGNEVGSASIDCKVSVGNYNRNLDYAQTKVYTDNGSYCKVAVIRIVEPTPDFDNPIHINDQYVRKREEYLNTVIYNQGVYSNFQFTKYPDLEVHYDLDGDGKVYNDSFPSNELDEIKKEVKEKLNIPSNFKILCIVGNPTKPCAGQAALNGEYIWIYHPMRNNKRIFAHELGHSTFSFLDNPSRWNNPKVEDIENIMYNTGKGEKLRFWQWDLIQQNSMSVP